MLVKTAAVLLITSLGAQAADLPKLRNFPVSIPGIPADVVRQYEYNPEIGPFGTQDRRIVSIDAPQGDNPEVKVNVAPWGMEFFSGSTRFVILHIFKGFTNLNYNAGPSRSGCGNLPDTDVPIRMQFIKNGAWPSQSFKIYTENVRSSYDLTCGYYKDGRRSVSHGKSLQECSLKNAASFGSLPGKIWIYRCDVTESADYQGATPTTQHGLEYAYSDYLDQVIMVRNTAHAAEQPLYSVKITYKDPAGTLKSIQVTNK